MYDHDIKFPFGKGKLFTLKGKNIPAHMTWANITAQKSDIVISKIPQK
jgi:hypothetical protein